MALASLMVAFFTFPLLLPFIFAFFVNLFIILAFSSHGANRSCGGFSHFPTFASTSPAPHMVAFFTFLLLLPFIFAFLVNLFVILAFYSHGVDLYHGIFSHFSPFTPTSPAPHMVAFSTFPLLLPFIFVFLVNLFIILAFSSHGANRSHGIFSHFPTFTPTSPAPHMVAFFTFPLLLPFIFVFLVYLFVILAFYSHGVDLSRGGFSHFPTFTPTSPISTMASFLTFLLLLPRRRLLIW